MNAYLLTVLANFSFSFGSQFFTYFSRRFSSTWMNTYKCLVALIGFLFAVLLTTGFNAQTIEPILLFILSGFIALGLGDILLLKAYQKIGPGRTMVLFGFHPVIIGVFALFLFDQVVDENKLWAIILFICCLMTFSYESFKESGQWEIKGLLFAFGGMSLDAIGVLITRYAFDLNSGASPFEGNFYRCLGALLSYILISRFSPIFFLERYRALTSKLKFYVFLGSFCGTFLSLALYLSAIKLTDDLATISAISVTGVIFSATFESIWNKKLPGKYFFMAFFFFAIGMYLIFF